MGGKHNPISKCAAQWHICSMSEGDRAASSRLRRLEELKGLLKSREHVTAAELSAELGVSLRTLNRDLVLLRDTGVPIESDRGRGGGLRLHRHWSIGRVNLDYREAIDVLLSLAVIEKLGSALVLGHVKSTRNKLAATFSPSHRHKIRLLRRRILIGPSASPEVMASYSPPAVRGGSVNEAFFEMRLLELVYLDANGRRSAREVEPQFLYLSWPVWYLLAWDQLRNDVRTFRVDRIAHAAMRADGFAFRPEGPFLKAIEGSGVPL